jgi:hypothetical protein
MHIYPISKKKFNAKVYIADGPPSVRTDDYEDDWIGEEYYWVDIHTLNWWVYHAAIGCWIEDHRVIDPIWASYLVHVRTIQGYEYDESIDLIKNRIA